jgi:probable FeS assembly SUF system protein SufT
MNEHREVTLKRDCEAIQIPSGLPVTLKAGAEVIITQALGGTYTVATREGLAQISGKDADALGFEVEAAPVKKEGESGEVTEEQVWDVLRTCYDPEIPVDIVDLGLVYDCSLKKQEDGSTRVDVKMTLTAPGCGMGPAIAAEARGKILALPGVDAAEVELVWDPPWNQGMISEAGRMKLGMI